MNVRVDIDDNTGQVAGRDCTTERQEVTGKGHQITQSGHVFVIHIHGGNVVLGNAGDVRMALEGADQNAFHKTVAELLGLGGLINLPEGGAA